MLTDEQETERMGELLRYDVLDTEAEPSFDRVTQLATHIFGVPIALVSLVDHERQWFKACIGLPLRETTREVAFCAHALGRSTPLVIEDTHADPRFRNNPLVTGPPFIRFYAGAPLTTPAGHDLGTLCIIDRAPRAFDEHARTLLMSLAAVVMDVLELRVRTRELDSARAALQQTTDKLTTVLDNMNEAVVAIDSERRTVLSNRAARNSLGDVGQSSDPDRWLARTDVFLPDQITPYPAERLPLIRALAGESTRGELLCVRGPDGARWHSVNASPLRDAGGAIVGGVSVGRDVTDAHELARRLEHAAIHDELTGVLNRRGFITLATPMLAMARRTRRPLLLLYFDLDGLKAINDELGHAAGDLLIRDAAQVLLGTLRDVDLVARIGGDELVVLCAEASVASAAAVMARLAEVLATANQAPRPAPISWSVGMATFDPDRPATLDELLRTADRAMYAEKQRRPPRP